MGRLTMSSVPKIRLLGKDDSEHSGFTARSAFTGELIGTYILVLFGTGSVAAAVVTGALVGLWQVAAVWAFGVALAIYVSANLSGAHLNPAVSLAFSILRRREFSPRLLPLYWTAQLAGAVLAGVTVLMVFGPAISHFEQINGLVRGADGSQLSAMVFGEYFPNPDVYGTDQSVTSIISPVGAAFVEGFGTAILVLVIFSLTDRRNAGLSTKNMTPLLIGFTVAALICVFAPLTQAGWNPARDFGPRLVAFFAGWGDIAIPGPSNGFWVYIVGPLIGGPVGAAVHQYLIRPGLGRVTASVVSGDRDGHS